MPSPAPAARTLPASAYARLKAATRRVIKDHGSADAAALDTRVGASHLLKCDSGNEEYATVFLSADCIADLEQRAARPHVTEALAALAGYVLIPAPPSTLPETAQTALFLRLVEEAGTVQARLAKALEDGRIERREIRDMNLLIEARKLFALVGEMVALLERIEVGAE